MKKLITMFAILALSQQVLAARYTCAVGKQDPAKPSNYTQSVGVFDVSLQNGEFSLLKASGTPILLGDAMVGVSTSADGLNLNITVFKGKGIIEAAAAGDSQHNVMLITRRFLVSCKAQ